MHILIGGYTKHESAGIYQFDFIGSGDQAHLEQRRNVVEVGGPTYFQKDGQFIFTIKNENGQGGIAAFANGKLVSQLLHEGSSPAYIGINKEKEKISLSIKATLPEQERPQRQQRHTRNERSFDNSGSNGGGGYRRNSEGGGKGGRNRKQQYSRNKTVYEENANVTLGDAFGSLFEGLDFDNDDNNDDK